MRYPTKIDTWIAALLLLGPILIAVISIAARVPALLLGVVPLALIILLLVLPCHYTLNADELIVRCGLLRIPISYRQIESVQPTRNPLSAPAMSLDRVDISYGNRRIMVSPVRREQFIAGLNNRVTAARKGI
jgi:hypothetical protein